jgi:hypothetical protein
MAGWLAEYLRTRDRGRPATDAAYDRLKLGHVPHLYPHLGECLVVPQWRAGHLRAAMLSGAAEASASYVEIAFVAAYPGAAAVHLAFLREEFSRSAFAPAFFRVEIVPSRARSVLKMSLFDRPLLMRVERALADEVRSAS